MHVLFFSFYFISSVGWASGCVWFVSRFPAAQEAGVCVSGEVCRRTAGPGLALHQHLPAGSQGTILYINTLSHWTRCRIFVLKVSACFLQRVFCHTKSFGRRNPAASLWQDPNQFIRASALRVLSSIRVHIIVPIMMLAIKEASADLSPYVRKTAAHAIQKLYRYTSAHLLLDEGSHTTREFLWNLLNCVIKVDNFKEWE